MTSWPVPMMPDVYDVIAEQKITLFGSLDMRAGYNQVMLDPATAHKTAFQTHEEKFVYNRLSFGLCNAVSFFRWLCHVFYLI
jgi:hypothetical protein